MNIEKLDSFLFSDSIGGNASRVFFFCESCDFQTNWGGRPFTTLEI